MSEIHIDLRLIPRLRVYLGKGGIEFFRMCKREHGSYSPILPGDGIPHPVHFREGLHIRNFMRGSGLCEGWDDLDYDNNWEEVVRLAVEEVIFPGMWGARGGIGPEQKPLPREYTTEQEYKEAFPEGRWFGLGVYGHDGLWESVKNGGNPDPTKERR
jgi:hypothetical protein